MLAISKLGKIFHKGRRPDELRGRLFRSARFSLCGLIGSLTSDSNSLAALRNKRLGVLRRTTTGSLWRWFALLVSFRLLNDISRGSEREQG